MSGIVATSARYLLSSYNHATWYIKPSRLHRDDAFYADQAGLESLDVSSPAGVEGIATTMKSTMLYSQHANFARSHLARALVKPLKVILPTRRRVFSKPVWTYRVRRGMSATYILKTRLARPAGCWALFAFQDSSA